MGGGVDGVALRGGDGGGGGGGVRADFGRPDRLTASLAMKITVIPSPRSVAIGTRVIRGLAGMIFGVGAVG